MIEIGLWFYNMSINLCIFELGNQLITREMWIFKI